MKKYQREEDYGANCPGFVHEYEKDNERADVTPLYI